MSRPRNLTIGLAVATVLALAYVMVVPARNYVTQQAATEEAEQQLAQLDREIEDLQQQQAALQDPQHIEQVARERFNLGYPGEEVFAILPAPPPPLPIPDGWPFDILRGAAAASTGGASG